MWLKNTLTSFVMSVSLLAPSLLTLQTFAASELKPQIAQTSQSQTTNQQAKQGRPHYLEILPLQEKLEKMTTLEKIVLSSRLPFKRDIKEADIPLPFLIAPDTARADIFPLNKQVHLVLPFYRELGNGKLEFLPTGEVVERQPIIADLTSSLEKAAEHAYSLFYNMPGNSNKCKEDYIANGMTMYFGYAHPMVGGQALLEVHKIGYYTKGRLDDEIWGENYILAHELIHANEQLQMIPWVVYNPFEMYAHMATIEKWGPFGFLSHSYSGMFRNLAEIYFDVYSPGVKQLISKDIFFYTELNAERLDELSKTISTVTKEFKQFTINEIYPEFLSNKVYWAILSKWLNDESFIVELMMARDYKPKVFSEIEKKIFLAKNGSLVEETINECWSKLSTFEREKKSELAGFKFRSSFSIKDNFTNLYREKYAKANNLVLEELLEEECDKLRLETEFAYNKFLKDKFLDNGKIKYDILSLSDAQKAIEQIYNEFEGWLYWYEKDNELSQSELAIYKKRLDECSSYAGRIRLAKLYSELIPGSTKFTPEILDLTVSLEAYFKLPPNYLTTYFKNLSNMMLENGMRFRPLLVSKDASTVGYKVVDPGFLIYEYDLFGEKGGSNGRDYIEVFRYSEGKLESKPLAIGFCSSGKGIDTLLVDYDQEGKEGFGSFDAAAKISSIGKNYEELLKHLKAPKSEAINLNPKIEKTR